MSSPRKNRWSIGKTASSTSRRPRLATTFCLTRPWSQTDSTIRTNSCTVPDELGTLTERMNIVDNYHYLNPPTSTGNSEFTARSQKNRACIITMCLENSASPPLQNKDLRQIRTQDL